MTQFKDLKVNDCFTRGDSPLVWSKTELFTAYGYIKNQNAAAYAEPKGPWHYDHVPEDENVNPVA